MKKNTIVYLAVLSVFAGSNCLGAIDGALSMIAQVMHVSQTTALYVGSVATLACMFSGVFFGAVAGKRLPYKASVIMCYILAIVSGVASVFLTYLILLIPLVLVFRTLPQIEYQTVEKTKNAQSKMPVSAVMMCIVLGIVWLNIAPLLFGSAFYAAALSDSATVAAVIAMMFSIGCMIGGLIFSHMYHKLGKYSYSVFLVVGAAGLVISGLAGNIVLLGLGFLIGGIGQSCMQAGVMMYLGLVCDNSQIGTVSALMTICLNLGAFLCSSWDSLIGIVTGDTLYIPLYIGAVIFVFMAAVLFIKPPVVEEK